MVHDSDNSKMALHLFKQASDQGLPDAMAQLGHIYEIGGYEDEKSGKFYPLVKSNIEEAITLYKNASASDNEHALNFLGAHAFNNEKNMDLAVENFRKASESERCGRSLNNLGMCFEIGIGNA
jgi:TPR repeat protein